MCVEHLESINFSATDLDTKGVAFERFLDGFFKGDFGQYFTPREIIQFCVAMMPPEADDYVLDTSCGSGGFLLYAMDHVRHQAASIQNEIARFRKWHDFAEKRLFGIEINDEISRVAKMNMILHDDGHTNVVAADGLEDWPRLKEINAQLKPAMFDIVLTNPPFGAVVKAAEKGQAYIDRLDLSRHLGKTSSDKGEKQKAGKAAVKQRASVKTEILFLERIHDFLKPGTGRAAIVVPDGILTNGSLQGVRDWVMDRFQILAVVSLPQAAFQHSGASVKASLLFVRRRADKEVANDDEAIFMAAPGNIGYDATGRDTVRMEGLHRAMRSAASASITTCSPMRQSRPSRTGSGRKRDHARFYYTKACLVPGRASSGNPQVFSSKPRRARSPWRLRGSSGRRKSSTRRQLQRSWASRRGTAGAFALSHRDDRQSRKTAAIWLLETRRS